MLPVLKSRYRNELVKPTEPPVAKEPIVERPIVETMKEWHETPNSILRPDPAKVEAIPHQPIKEPLRGKESTSNVYQAGGFFEWQRTHPAFSQLGLNSIKK